MKKKLMIVGIVVILLTVVISGCTSNPLDTERNKFVGTWTCVGGSSKGSSFTCFSDGTGTMSAVSITWALKEGKFVISAKGITILYNYSFSDNDSKLILTITGGIISDYYLKN